MPRFKPVRGPSATLLEERFEPTLAAADRLRAVAVERLAAIEGARTGALRRNRERLADKHGADSAEARRAAAEEAAHVITVTAFSAEVARVKLGAVAAQDGEVLIHGRVLDARHAGVPGLLVAAVDAAGTPLARAKTDESGHFQLRGRELAASAASPGRGGEIVTAASAAAGPTRATARRPRLVVSDANERELHAEAIDELQAGQARYRQIVLKR